ncbi:MAG: fibronectin type III domain-containing protein, partial [Actinomycetota bacterium]
MKVTPSTMRRHSALFAAMRAAGSVAFSLALLPFLYNTSSAQTRHWGANGIAVSTSGAVQGDSSENTQISSDTTGGIYVVWADTGGVAPLAYRASLYATHYDANGALAAGWPTAQGGRLLISNRVSTNTDGTSISLVSDNAGGFIVAWTTGGPTLANRVNGSGVAAWTGLDDGTPGGLIAVPIGDAFELVASGDALFILTMDPGTFEFYINALNLSSGAQHTGFTGFGRKITEGVDPAGGDLVASPAGGAQASAGVIGVLLAQFSPNVYDLNLIRVDVTGAVNWTSSATTAGTAALQQDGDAVNLAPDGAGGAYMVWGDTRSVDPGFYAAHYPNTCAGPTCPNAWGTEFRLDTSFGISDVGLMGGSVEGFAVSWSTPGANWGGNTVLQIIRNNGAGTPPTNLRGTADLGPSYTRQAEAASFVVDGHPMYALGFRTNYAINPRPAGTVSVYNSSGTEVFSGYPLGSTATEMLTRRALGVGNRFAFLWGQDRSCPSGGGQCTGSNLYIQAVSTAAPATSAITNLTHNGSTTTLTTIAGTAFAQVGLSLVEVSVQRMMDGKFWTGSSWTATTGIFVPASGTTNWTLESTLGINNYFQPSNPANIGDTFSIVSRAKNTNNDYQGVFTVGSSSISVRQRYNVPSNIVVSSVSATTLSVSWEPNGNPQGVQYHIDFTSAPCGDNSGSGWSNSANTTGFSGTANGLLASTAYRFSVNPVNNAGWDEYSANGGERGVTTPASGITVSPAVTANPCSGQRGAQAVAFDNAGAVWEIFTTD